MACSARRSGVFSSRACLDAATKKIVRHCGVKRHKSVAGSGQSEGMPDGARSLHDWEPSRPCSMPRVGTNPVHEMKMHGMWMVSPRMNTGEDGSWIQKPKPA